LVEIEKISLSSLKEAKLDTQIKYIVENDGAGMTYQEKKPVYGVLLVSDKSTIFDGYSFNREQQQKIVDQINNFLNN
jgi:hypothetical protein